MLLKRGRKNIPAEGAVGSVDVGLPKKEREYSERALPRTRGDSSAFFFLSLNRWKSPEIGAGSWEGSGNTRMEPSPAAALSWHSMDEHSSRNSRSGLEKLIRDHSTGKGGPRPRCCSHFPPCIPRISPSGAADSGLNPGGLGSLFLLGTAMDQLPIPGFLGNRWLWNS